MQLQPTSSWGLYPVVNAHTSAARFEDDLARLVKEGMPLLAQGSRRSYGDACLAAKVVSLLGLNHLLDFDPDEGLLRAQAGITLDRILRFIVPRGWFLPVTPGTKFPTLGGCLAADVHGKNHHLDGSISNFVEELEMVLADGTSIRCTPGQHSELFWATLGGMGLTGFIYAATLRLRAVSSAYICLRSVKTTDLGDTCRLFAQTQRDNRYSMAWIDTLATGSRLGRSIVLMGDHAPAAVVRRSDPLKLHAPPRLTVPFHLPGPVLNRWSVKTFNALYYHRHWRHRRDAVVHYDPFFYPLDAIDRWNRIYGRAGFLQYQFVLPFAAGIEAVGDILQRIAARGTGSFLAVLKTLGDGGGPLSFPLPGYTLALDFPLHDRGIIPFLRQLDRLVAQAGGRVYLAKDAILQQEDFVCMYPRLDEFKRIKDTYDPDHLFRSHQSDRLGLT